jgi:hypothetical protein
MGWRQRWSRAPRLPGPVRTAIALGPGERVLAWAPEAGTGSTILATTHRLLAVGAAGELAVSRPWHEADSGVWDHDGFRLTVTWVDGGPRSRWVLPEPSLLPETVRERVQASVVLAERLDLGHRGSARVVLRQDLATGALLEQVVPGRGVAADDPELARRAAAALAELKEHVGLS